MLRGLRYEPAYLRPINYTRPAYQPSICHWDTQYLQSTVRPIPSLSTTLATDCECFKVRNDKCKSVSLQIGNATSWNRKKAKCLLLKSRPGRFKGHGKFHQYLFVRLLNNDFSYVIRRITCINVIKKLLDIFLHQFHYAANKAIIMI